jgi:N utilization substance protein B
MTPQALRAFAFDHLYPLPSADHPDNAPSPDQVLATLQPEERTLAFHVAARRLAFQLLYQLDAAATPPDENALAAFVHHALAHVPGLGPIDMDQTTSLIIGAHNARKQADAEFFELAPEWPTSRLAAVDRSILRLAHFEMTSGRTPPKIAVNEAVELAKHYSTEISPAFMNGLLDKVLKRIEPPPADK